MRQLLFFVWLLFPLGLKGETLDLWYSGKHFERWLEFSVAQFEKESGINVKLSHVPTGELKPVLVRVSGTGQAPDVVIAPSDFIDLSDIARFSTIPSSLVANYQQQELLSKLSFDGKLYAIPLLTGSNQQLFYNKKLVKKAAKNWHELIEQGEELQKQGITPISWRYNNLYSFYGSSAQSKLYSLIGCLPSHSALLEEFKMNSDEKIQLYVSSLDKTITLPNHPAMRASWYGMQKGLTLLLSGYEDIEAIAKLMQHSALGELDRISDKP